MIHHKKYPIRARKERGGISNEEILSATNIEAVFMIATASSILFPKQMIRRRYKADKVPKTPVTTSQSYLVKDLATSVADSLSSEALVRSTVAPFLSAGVF